MNLIFKSTKNKKNIKKRLIIISTIFAFVISFIVGINQVFNEYFLSLIYPCTFVSCFLIFLVIKLISDRYYILDIIQNEDTLIIHYLFFLKLKTIELKRTEFYFRIQENRGGKSLEFIINDKCIINQTSCLEWDNDRIIKVKDKLEQNGFIYKTYW